MDMSYQDLEDELAEVLASAKQLLPTESFAEACHYMDHNEFELALDTIAATIAASGTHVGPELYAKFISLGNEMQMDESFWESIRPNS
jgi:hypothetical protein